MLKRYALLFDNAFYVSVFLKGIGGTLELISALIVLMVSTETFFHITEPFKYVGLNTSEDLAGAAKEYVFWYLFSHGVVRVGLAYALLKEYLWAYPVAITVLLGFTGYQVYLFAGHPSVGLAGLMLFNLLIITLTWYEYHKLKQGHHLHRPSLDDLKQKL
jgi:uncharacterized membrane protein